VIRLRWLARVGLQRLGWQGMAGIGLTIAACAFCAAVLLPMDARVAGLKAQMSLPHKEGVDAAHAARPSDPAAELDAFYGSFPGDDALTDLLAKLHGLGDEHGLALQQADYRAADERGQRLGQYRITVPAVATYPQLKQFLAAVLTEMPNLSLDQLSLQRRAMTDSRVEVQMQFTLYLRQRR
jgi:hypothetical protein